MDQQEKIAGKSPSLRQKIALQEPFSDHLRKQLPKYKDGPGSLKQVAFHKKSSKPLFFWRFLPSDKMEHWGLSNHT